MAVNDNNPLYRLLRLRWRLLEQSVMGSTVSDNLLGGLSLRHHQRLLLSRTHYVAHHTQNLHSLYAQDDWKVMPKLTLNLGLRWEYGSPYADLYNRISNFDPASQTVLTTTPGAVAGNGITPFSGGGTYGKTLVNPDYTDFGPRVGFAYAVDSKTAPVVVSA